MRTARLLLSVLTGALLFGFIIGNLHPDLVKASPGNACKYVNQNCYQWIICEYEDILCSTGEFHVHMKAGEHVDCDECDLWVACLTYCPIE